MVSTLREERLMKLKEFFEANPDKLITTKDILNHTDETRTICRTDLRFLSNLKIIETIETPTRGRTYSWNNTYKLKCRCEIKQK